MLNVPFYSCVYHELDEIPTCVELPLLLKIVALQDNSSCNSATGSITVASTGGMSPIRYSLNGQNFQDSEYFSNLQAGTYNIEALDNRGCNAAVEAVVNSIETDLVVTATITDDTECQTGNGTASFEVSGGTPPYQFTFAGVSTASLPFLEDLNHGTYFIEATDAVDCSYSTAFVITRGLTGVSWQNDISPIINTRCAKSGCHVGGTGRIDFTSFNNVKAYATSIKQKTTERSMPYDGSLEGSQIQLIACWVDDGAPEN